MRATLLQSREIWGVQGYKHSTITRPSTTHVVVVDGAATAAVGDLVAVANTSVAVCVHAVFAWAMCDYTNDKRGACCGCHLRFDCYSN